MKKITIYALAALAGGGVLAVAPAAQAQTTCTSSAPCDCTMSANIPHPVYVAGSTASKTYLENLAALFAALTPPITLIYAANIPAGSTAGSCQGVQDIATASFTESGAEFEVITPTGALSQCSAGGNAYAPNGVYVDIGVADVYPKTCADTLGSGFTLDSAKAQVYDGAIQAMEIAVPYGSSKFSISADAAYVVFGYAGGTYKTKSYTVSPWTVSTDIWTRGDLSGTQLMTATAIGLSGNLWLSGLGADAGAVQVAGGSSALLTNIQTSAGLPTGPDPVIGILTNAQVDPNKKVGGVRGLAFQASGQDCGYYPDSTKDLFDKINVRQGRYQIWGYEHFITYVKGGKPIANPSGAGANGNAVPSADADVQTVINVLTHAGLTGTSTPTLEAVITAETSGYFIPQCAMQVTRTTEDGVTGGDASYQPPQGCGCWYESQPHGGAGNQASYCNPCTKDSDCPTAHPKCNFGYCEVQ